MSLKINKLTLKQLIEAYDHDTEILKKHYLDLWEDGSISEAYYYSKLARRKAIRKVLVEVKKQKTTTIKAEQVKLF